MPEFVIRYKVWCETEHAFVEALSQADDATLNKVVMAPWGLEAPLLSLAHVISSHIWYHDGQLNFIQCLLGDGKYHWSGD